MSKVGGEISNVLEISCDTAGSELANVVSSRSIG